MNYGLKGYIPFKKLALNKKNLKGKLIWSYGINQIQQWNKNELKQVKIFQKA